MRRRITRRRVVKGVITATGAAAVAKVAAQPATSASLAASDVAAADRVAGRSYANDAEREMMAEGLASRRAVLQSLRGRHIPPDVEPAAHFSPRLPGTVLPPGPSACTVSPGDLPAYNGDPATLAFCTATELSRLIHARKVTSVELTRMYLDRLKEIGPRLNCVVTVTEALALAQAARADAELAAGRDRGPLHGVPYGAKDLLATKGIATTWGAAPYKSQVFDGDATVVKKLESAGAVLLAKLSLGELAMGDYWFNGLTRNPWKPDSGSSGSSAGPGAATAGGLVGFSIGSETLGSIVSPSVTCGVTGLRPTYGRVSRHGAMPLARTMDKLGPMCRGVEDCALVLAAVAGTDELDPTAADVPFRWDASLDLKAIRLGIDVAGFERLMNAKDDPKTKPRKELYAAALDQLRKIFGELRPVALPPADPYKGLAGLLIGCESAGNFSELLTSGRVRELAQQGPDSWPNAFRIGATIPAADYLRAMQVRTQLQHAMREAMKDVDAYVTMPFAGPTMAFTNLTGHPSLVTRCGIANDLPASIEFIGQLYREDLLVRVGVAFEAATGANVWPDTTRIPPLPPH